MKTRKLDDVHAYWRAMAETVLGELPPVAAVNVVAEIAGNVAGYPDDPESADMLRRAADAAEDGLRRCGYDAAAARRLVVEWIDVLTNELADVRDYGYRTYRDYLGGH